MSVAKRSLRPIEAVVVIILVAIVGLCLYGGFVWGAAALHRRAVRAAIPVYVDGLKGQRDRLSAAIERYHAQFGFYPPPGKSPAQRNQNALYYELGGTRWNEKTRTLGLPTTKDPVDRAAIEKTLGIASFSNTLVFPNTPTNFLVGTGLAGRQEGELILLISGASEGVPEGVADDFIVTPWNYVVGEAAHNKGKFDIWMDVEAVGQKIRVQNWQ